MENEDYVSYEVAEKLSTKGYDEYSDYIYKIDDENSFKYEGNDTLWVNGNLCNSVLNKRGYISAPSLYDAQKWLREQHKIDVLITFDTDDDTDEPLGYSFDIWQNSKFMDFCMNFKTYEEALNEGIKRALKYI